MTLSRRGEFSYGDSQADPRLELADYSHGNGYPIEHNVEVVCVCGNRLFSLLLDGEHGVAVRVCEACGLEHPIRDSDEFMEDAELEECECPCEAGGVIRARIEKYGVARQA